MITESNLEYWHKSNLLPIIFVGLISADNLVNAESCTMSLDIFKEMQKVFPNTNIPEEDWKSFVESGIQICKRELNMFLSSNDKI